MRLNRLSEMMFDVKKVHFEGKNEASCSIILPHKYVDQIGIVKGNYMKIHLEQDKIWMQKIEDNGVK